MFKFKIFKKLLEERKQTIAQNVIQSSSVVHVDDRQLVAKQFSFPLSHVALAQERNRFHRAQESFSLGKENTEFCLFQNKIFQN